MRLPREILAEAPMLFHDVRVDEVDPAAHATFVMERVLDRGTMRSVRALVALYGEDRIREDVWGPEGSRSTGPNAPSSSAVTSAASNGANRNHAALSVAVSGRLLAALRDGPCRVYGSALRVLVPESGLATYPDVTVVCGELEHDPESATTVTNPTLVVEVLSASTADHDRGEKLDHYQRIPGLRACLLVATDRRSVEVVRRRDGTWSREELGAGDHVELESPPVRLSIDEIYRDAGL